MEKTDKTRKQAEAEEKRQKIIQQGLAMERLRNNPDFMVLVEDLTRDKNALLLHLLNENTPAVTEQVTRVRLVARINQIDRVLQKPNQAIRLMKALKEVREAITNKK